jgi:hypothetical protein
MVRLKNQPVEPIIEKQIVLRAYCHWEERDGAGVTHADVAVIETGNLTEIFVPLAFDSMFIIPFK